MLNLPEFNLPLTEHRQRQASHEEAAKHLKESFATFNYTNLDTFNFVVPMKHFYVPMASDPQWANRPFGAVNTVQNSACVAFVAKMILDFYEFDISMEDLLSEIENKGYRMWKLAKKAKTLNLPYPEVKAIKNQFYADDPIQLCNTLESIYELYGEPVGIGGSMFVIDNIINIIATKPVRIYNDTRIHSVHQLLWNLINGIPVPIRVQNSIYHDDPSRTEEHYVMLIGISCENAILLDSSYSLAGGINILPVTQLFKAMLWDDKLVCAWNLSPCT